MAASAETRPLTSALLTIHVESGDWAIPSAAVQTVEPFDAQSPEPLLDVLALLGFAAVDAGHAVRVLVLRVAGEQLRLLVRGALTLTDISTESLLPLPAALARVAPLISHVALVSGKPSLCVLSPEHLLSAWIKRSPSPNTSTTSLEASSC